MKQVLTFALVVVLVCAVSVHAQSEDRAVVLSSAPIMLRPNATLTPLRVAASGTVLHAFEEESDWLRVQFQDPQLGLRNGYIETKFVRIERAGLRPIDLSVPSEQPAPRLTAVTPAPAAPTLAPGAQIPNPIRVPNRVFVDVDVFTFFPNQGEVTTTSTRTLFSQTATAAVVYQSLPTSWEVMPSVRVMLGREVGIGGRFLWAEYVGLAAVAVRIPHPTLANRFGTDTATGVYERKDWMLDLNVAYLHNTRRWRTLVFGGPSYFHSSHDLIDRVAYFQNATIIGGNGITITSTPTVNVSGSGWGANMGGDVSFFPWRYVGFGGGAVYTNGKMSLDDPLTDSPVDFDLGSTTLLGGARFRF